MQKILTRNSEETKNLAKFLAEEIRGGEIICLSGDLGAGKTTFTQGLLEGMGVEGPYTSPTFAIIKEYCVTHTVERGMQNVECKKQRDAIHAPRSTFHVYHIDAYRVEEKDLLNLAWKDFAGKENTVTIVEWAERIKNLIPTGALWINFEWINENEREITISKSKK